jgi:hypothetical protein
MTSSATATTRTVMENMYAAARNGDLDTLARLMHPAVRVDEPPFLPYGGTYTGLAEFAGVFTRAATVINLSELRLESLTVEHKNAFALVTVPLVNTGETTTLVEHWIVTDGLITSGRIYWFDHPTADPG